MTTVKFETMDPVTKRVIVKKYYEYMVDIAVMFGANRTRAEIEVSESIEFELKMSNVSTNPFQKKQQPQKKNNTI